MSPHLALYFIIVIVVTITDVTTCPLLLLFPRVKLSEEPYHS